MQERITSPALLQYGVLAVPVAFAGFPLYVLAPDYYATHHGVSLASLGLMLLALRLFDAFQDPLIGYASDRYRSRVRWYMPAAALLLCASMYALFNQLYFHPLLWFGLCIGLAVTAYSILSINLSALGALWTTKPDQQTRIAAYREAFALVGLVVAVSLPALLTQLLAPELVYAGFTLVLIAVMLPALLLFLRWVRVHLPLKTSSKQPPLRRPFFALLRTLPADSKKLLLVYGISMLASSIPAVLVLFFVRDLLGAESYTGLFLLLYFLSGALIMPVWKRLSLIYGKYRTWLFSMLLAVASFIWAFTLGEGDIAQYAVICIVSGMALGADLVMPPSLLADQLHIHSAQDSASTHYALLMLLAKAALALASAIVLPLLQGAGFTPASANSPAALGALSTAYALIPCILKLTAGACVWRLFIHTKKGDAHEEINHNRTNRSSRHA